MGTQEEHSTHPDRVLGDKWLDWDEQKENQKNTTAGRSVFLFFAFIAVCVLIGGLFLFLYLVTPRLQQIHANLYRSAIVGTYAVSVFLLLGYLAIAFAVLFEKNIGVQFFKKTFNINSLLPLSLNIAGRFGISKDKLSHSFIKVSNTIIRTLKPGREDNRLLVLLPRCLEKEYLQKIKAFEEKYCIKVNVVSGGSRAREVIYEFKPHAVIGVACERDLLSGIRDISGKIPVIGVANKRPKGPCKATTVDVDEIEESIRFFLNQQN